MFEEKKEVIYMGSDHAGYEAKTELQKYVEGLGYKVIDLGAFSEEPVDYPDVAREVSEKIYESEKGRGILICGTGIGISMAANKMKGIRAALCTNEEMAEMAKRHNNANVLAMGARITDIEEMKKITDKFLNTDFEKEEERHVRRAEKIDSLSKL